ncbi:L-noviosyl transferase [compost metagenome]
MIKPEFYQVAQEACHLLGFKAILVTQYDEHVPQPLKDDIHVFKYLPLKHLMPHVRAIIHHGGIGTLSEAVNAGIPQLILPYFADRPDNAFRLSELGVAEFIPPVMWNPSLLSEALLRLLSPDSITRCMDLSQRARNQNTALMLCETIESMVSNNEFLIQGEFTGWDEGLAEADTKKNNTMDTSQLTAEKKQLIAQLLRKKVSIEK